MSAGVEQLLRECAPQVLGVLARRYGNFDAAEDAVQEALLAASQQWPVAGIPESPRAWLITIASRRLVDHFRSDAARRERESSSGPAPASAPAADEEPSGTDDTLTVLLLCCHPVLSLSSQVALTLRAVGGLTTPEIAMAFMVPEATMAQRISRAKASVKKAGARFVRPAPADVPGRLNAVLHVLYLIFNEGYTATKGAQLQRADLATEAIRLTRLVHRILPSHAEAAGLLALMLLTDARRDARVNPAGELIPLDEQDRACWDQAAIAEGVALISAVLPRGEIGPYQVQAAIAAVHDEARTAADTDWAQLDQLYQVLERLTPGPMVTLNRAVAVAMTAGPQAGLDLVAGLDGELGAHHRLSAVRAHLLEMLGDQPAARMAYLSAAERALSLPEQRYLRRRAAALG